MHNNRIIGSFLVIIASLFYGVMPAITQKAIALGLSVETILSGRYLLGTVLIWLYILLKKRDVQVGRNNMAFLLFIGCIMFVCTVLMSESYKHIPGAVAAILVFLYVAIVVVLEIIMGREKVQRFRMICLSFALVGMIAVVWTPEGGTKLSFLGISLALAAGFTYALSAVAMAAGCLAVVSAEVVMGYAYLVPMLFNSIRCIAAGLPLFPGEPAQWACILLLGFGSGFIAPVAFCQAIKLIGASDAALINTMEPLVAYLAGIIIMSDHISWNATLGGVLIAGSILFLNLSKKKQIEKEKISS